MGTITIIDGIYCKASRDLWPAISRLMEYEGERWKMSPGGFGRQKEIKTRSFLDHRGGKFLCGFLPRVQKDLMARGTPAAFSGIPPALKPEQEPFLRNTIGGIRPEQLQLQKDIARVAVKRQRGVIQAPTGSGKTTIAMLIASMFYPKHRILFLCHTISLLTQTRDEFVKNGFEKIHLIGGAFAKGLDFEAKITIATIQTFCKIPVEVYCDQFDVVLVDESHHVNNVDSQYGKVLTRLLAPVKIGFTATIPTAREAALALEGIIGPIIGEISIQEGVELKIMAKPKIKLVPIPHNSLFGDIRKYNELYRAAIVDSRIRNSRIAAVAVDLASSGLSSLIIVKEIQHGDNITDMIRMKGHKCSFVQGNTSGEIRDAVKEQLEQKGIKIVVCTAVWKEGVNIPSLNCVINAAGGKSEISTLQAIGRGLRSVPGKKEIVIYDFLDPYKYLAQHAIQRIAIYVEAGWL
jgi:superfamily II DNA or RNA helicase